MGLDYIIFHRLPDPYSLAGALIIVIGAFCVVLNKPVSRQVVLQEEEQV